MLRRMRGWPLKPSPRRSLVAAFDPGLGLRGDAPELRRLLLPVLEEAAGAGRAGELGVAGDEVRRKVSSLTQRQAPTATTSASSPSTPSCAAASAPKQLPSCSPPPGGQGGVIA